jgi:hypothetical protein
MRAKVQHSSWTASKRESNRRATPLLRLKLFFLALLSLPAGAAAASPDRSAAAEIMTLINQYRSDNGLPAVPYSRALTMVAEAHAADLASDAKGAASGSFGTDKRGLPCNMHSWSGRGRWTPVCYTADHRYAAGMWSKPREITDGAYPWAGFEIAHWTSGSVTAPVAVAGWARSPGHNAVILERGKWKESKWRAMGVGVAGGFAFVWFGKEPDPQP